MWFRMKIIIMLCLFLLLIINYIISRKKQFKIVESKVNKFLKNKGYKIISTNNKIIIIGVLIKASVKDNDDITHEIVCKYNPFRSPKILVDKII